MPDTLQQILDDLDSVRQRVLNLISSDPVPLPASESVGGVEALATPPPPLSPEDVPHDITQEQMIPLEQDASRGDPYSRKLS